MYDIQVFMFYIQYIIVTPSPKANTMKQNVCYFYLGGLFHGTSIRISNIIDVWNLCNPLTLGVLTFGYSTTYILHQDIT